MDVHKTRDRNLSILNDNDSPSFAVRPKCNPLAAPKIQTSSIPQIRRPSLGRQAPYSKIQASSTSFINSPPLLRFDSSSSKSSNSSMDSSPSPITPFAYADPSLIPFDPTLQQNGLSYMPSPSTITPLFDQSMLLTASINDPSLLGYPTKAVVISPAHQSSYPAIPQQPSEIQQLPTPTSSSGISNPSPPNNQLKKNKYPCPYASSHSCMATFTTSGHAARHGKKHTGEKGVHCPVCNKAFTRKDNMKQHERTHKGSISGSNSEDAGTKKSKAAVTKEAAKRKKDIEAVSLEGVEPSAPIKTHSRKASIIPSPLSEVSSIPSASIDQPQQTLPQLPEPAIMPDPLFPETTAQDILNATQSGMYPPLSDSTMLSIVPNLDKSSLLGLSGQAAPPPPPPPPLMRGFSDLDTLASAAEAYNDPFYTGQL